MEEILFRYNPWWEEEFSLINILPRKTIFNQLVKLIPAKEIVIITGLRRIGKTTLMKLLINYLIKNQNVDPKFIFYISLDDYLLGNKSIIEIVDDFRKVNKIKFDQKIYLFLDEITYKDKYELQLKNIYDNQNAKVFVSSSSASILKSKKSFITGRNKIIEILPLNFDEYLLFKNIKILKRDKQLVNKYFEDFLMSGGIPEYVLTNDIEYLKELVDDIIQKDIAALHNIKNTRVLIDLFILLMERVGKVFSINKISHILGISVDTVRRYLEMFSETYLIYLLPRFGKVNERLLSPKKIYSADVGIKTLFTGFRDIGSLFENYIYLQIKDRNPSYIYKDGIEIDFYTEDKTLIEVKYNSSLTEQQKELFDSFNAKEKVIIQKVDDISKLNMI